MNQINKTEVFTGGKTLYRIYQCMCMMRSFWGLGSSSGERIRRKGECEDIPRGTGF